MILHNSIRVAQNLSRRNSHAQIKLGDMPSLNNRVRLTYGHRNPLNNFNYRETRELANPLNRLDYNESLELDNSLIIAKNANGVSRVQSGPGQNNVKRGLEVPTNIVGSGEDDGKNHHQGEQHRQKFSFYFHLLHPPFCVRLVSWPDRKDMLFY